MNFSVSKLQINSLVTIILTLILVFSLNSFIQALSNINLIQLDFCNIHTIKQTVFQETFN